MSCCLYVCFPHGLWTAFSTRSYSCVSHMLLHNTWLQRFSSLQNPAFLISSHRWGQKPESSLPGWGWLRVSHEAAFKLSAKIAVIWGLDPGQEICFQAHCPGCGRRLYFLSSSLFHAEWDSGSSMEVNVAVGFHEWVIQERTRQKAISLITWTMSDTPSLLSCAIGDTEHPDRMWEDPWKDVNIREQHPWGSSRSLASIISPDRRLILTHMFMVNSWHGTGQVEGILWGLLRIQRFRALNISWN